MNLEKKKISNFDLRFESYWHFEVTVSIKDIVQDFDAKKRMQY